MFKCSFCNFVIFSLGSVFNPRWGLGKNLHHHSQAWTMLTDPAKMKKIECLIHLFFAEETVAWHTSSRSISYPFIFVSFDKHSSSFLLSLCFKFQGLPSNLELSQRLPRRYSQNPADVFALVKHNICDTELSQDPLLVLPGQEKAAIRRFWQSAANHPGILANIDDQRKDDLLEFANALSVYPQFTRAVEYYRGLAGQSSRTRLPPHRMEFLLAGGAHHESLVVANLPPREPRPKPHPLRVRFHRWNVPTKEKVNLHFASCLTGQYLQVRICLSEVFFHQSEYLCCRFSIRDHGRRPFCSRTWKRRICEIQRKGCMAGHHDGDQGSLHWVLSASAQWLQPSSPERFQFQVEGWVLRLVIRVVWQLIGHIF